MRYLEKLFDIYVSTKNEESFKTKQPNIIGEFGEICLMDKGFLFLLTGVSGKYATGYKVSEWVDFATQNDFIFKFQGQTWMAILEHKLWVPKKNLKSIGMMGENDLDIFFEFDVNGKDLPKSHTGLTIPLDDENYPQNKFRKLEMADVAEYIFSQHEAIDEAENNIISLDEFKSLFTSKLKKIDLPKAAASSAKTAYGENFVLYYENNILIVKIDSNVVSQGLLKIIIDGDEFVVIPEGNRIEVEIFEDYLPLEYLAQKIIIKNA